MSPYLTRTVRPVAPARSPETRTLRVALAGCGTVGGALVRLIRERGPAIAASAGLRLDLVGVLVRDPVRPRDSRPPVDLLTADLNRFLDTDADVVVEAVGGLEPGLTIARAALSRGRTFVTANKALVAAAGPELIDLAHRHRATCAFEGAVAGGVPVVRTLQGLIPHTRIRSIRGVLNGTTNYVLTRMEAGAGFDAAVREAQDRGFAEADPTRDLDGRDAADKIAILAWEAFGTAPDSLSLTCRGLLPDPEALVEDGRALGGVVRLVAECVLADGRVNAAVEPVLVPTGSPIAALSAEENLVLVETESTGTIALTGPGAGGGPTASAILSDIMAAASGARLRPRRVGPSASGGDPRPHAWAIGLPVAGDVTARLEAAAARTGVPLNEIRYGNGSARAVTRPVQRHRAEALADALEEDAPRPRLLRYEL
jgi:homoserine dehydrogenase